MGQVTNYLDSQYNSLTGKNDEKIVGIENFTALIRTSETENYTNEVTENPLESGARISDHIIKNPTTFSIAGIVTDLHEEGLGYVKPIDSVFRTTSVVTAYLPPQSQAAAQRVESQINEGLSIVNKADQIVEDGKTVAGALGINFDSESLREAFRKLIIDKWMGGQTIKLEMNGNIWENIAIVSCSFSYNNEEERTEFSLELKEIEIVDTTTIAIKADENQGDKYGAIKNQGSTLGLDVGEFNA